MLRKVTTWCTKTGLNVYPDKTELVVFTRKHKVPTFTPPSLAGKKLEAKDSAKYLGVILDRKLNWNEHLEEKIRKFHAAFWLCRGTFGGGWGLKPKMLVWLYKAVLVPRVAYASVIWWPKTEQISVFKKLEGS